MSTATIKTTYTPADLLKMPDWDRFELVDGELVEKKMSLWSSYVAKRVLRKLDDYCESEQLGWVLPEGTTFQCFPQSPNKVRKADVSFIQLDRLPLEEAQSEGHTTISPDLVVEVVSPNDLYYEVDKKGDDWLESGVRLLWVINPDTHRVRVRRPGGETTLEEHEELSGEEVVPGFRCRISDFFQPPSGAKEATSAKQS